MEAWENPPLYKLYPTQPLMSFPPSCPEPVETGLPWGEPCLEKCVGVGGEGRQVCRKSLAAAFCERLYNWYSTVCGIFQLLAEKHRVVVNHSTAAVQAISAWELGRDVGTSSCPQEPHRAISEAQ